MADIDEFIDGNLVVSVETMRKSDAWTIANLTDSKTLMARAGKAVFDSVDWNNRHYKKVAIVCGKGNNAGDGYVIAKLLKDSDIDVELILLYPENFSEDGKYYFDECVKSDVAFKTYENELIWEEYGIIVDCIFGTGFKGNAKGVVAKVIEDINSSGSYIVAVDINSGLNGDTGLGEVYIKSDLTVSIGTYKYGHFRGNAEIAMKNKVNCDIGIVIQ